jgi:hypothetical protein
LTFANLVFYLCSMTQIAIRSHCPNAQNRFFTPLAALGREAPAMASRFRRWRGASGKSYLVSVYAIDKCPDYVDAVLVAVDGASGAIVWIGETSGGGENLAAILAGAAKAGANQAHVHLLAGGARERAGVIKDIDGRH